MAAVLWNAWGSAGSVTPTLQRKWPRLHEPCVAPPPGHTRCSYVVAAPPTPNNRKGLFPWIYQEEQALFSGGDGGI